MIHTVEINKTATHFFKNEIERVLFADDILNAVEFLVDSDKVKIDEILVEVDRSIGSPATMIIDCEFASKGLWVSQSAATYANEQLMKHALERFAFPVKYDKQIDFLLYMEQRRIRVRWVILFDIDEETQYPLMDKWERRVYDLDVEVHYAQHANGAVYCVDCAGEYSVAMGEDGLPSDLVYTDEQVRKGREPICDICNSTITEDSV